MMKALIPALALLILNLTDGAAPTKGKYVYSEEGAWASINWQECDPDYWRSSYVSLYGYESVSKVQDNGKPETNKYPYVYASYERWYDCSSDSMTHTYLWFSEPTSTSVDVKKNLKSGSVSLTAPALLVTEVCAPECPYDYWCFLACPKEGTDPEYKSAEVTLEATLVGTGTPYTSTSKSTFRSPDVVYHDKYSGSTMEATISALTFTVNGETMPIPTNAEKSATMSTTKYGSFTKYDNSI